MNSTRTYDVIIIGGSYAGLSAAMSLGRSLRHVLVIDSASPCNSRTPHSHNFLTQDGQAPEQISRSAREQVGRYDTVKFHQGHAQSAVRADDRFQIVTAAGETFSAERLILATGLKDIMPDIEGFAECWAISILHCPYCHGYEVRNRRTGIIHNGEMAFELGRMLLNWTRDLVVFTNGESSLSQEQTSSIGSHGIEIIETVIEGIEHTDGQVRGIALADGSMVALEALYAHPEFVQHSDIPLQLGCQMNEQGLVVVDAFQETTVPGVYACGDNSNAGRAISISVSSGSLAGVFLNRDLIQQSIPMAR